MMPKFRPMFCIPHRQEIRLGLQYMNSVYVELLMKVTDSQNGEDRAVGKTCSKTMHGLFVNRNLSYIQRAHLNSHNLPRSVTARSIHRKVKERRMADPERKAKRLILCFLGNI